jgi:hypothetical protein
MLNIFFLFATIAMLSCYHSLAAGADKRWQLYAQSGLLLLLSVPDPELLNLPESVESLPS